MPINFRPHETMVDPSTRLPVVHQLHNYVCLLDGDKKYYVQHGDVYLGGGELLTQSDLPEEFWTAYRALTSTQRRAVELELPGDQITSLADLPTDFLATLQSLPPELRNQLFPPSQDPPLHSFSPSSSPGLDESEDEDELEPLPPLRPPRPTSWQCTQCGKDVPVNQKGVHIGAHTRAARRKATHE